MNYTLALLSKLRWFRYTLLDCGLNSATADVVVQSCVVTFPDRVMSADSQLLVIKS